MYALAERLKVDLQFFVVQHIIYDYNDQLIKKSRRIAETYTLSSHK
jgi:hypothetical protein